MRITSDWPYEMKGKPAMPVAAPASAPLMTVRRDIPLRWVMAAFSSVYVLWFRSRLSGASIAMDLGIRDLRVMVSAGAAGIGLEIARAFVRERAKVHVCDVDGQALGHLAKSDPGLTSSACDVSEREQVE